MKILDLAIKNANEICKVVGEFQSARGNNATDIQDLKSAYLTGVAQNGIVAGGNGIYNLVASSNYANALSGKNARMITSQYRNDSKNFSEEKKMEEFNNLKGNKVNVITLRSVRNTHTWNGVYNEKDKNYYHFDIAHPEKTNKVVKPEDFLYAEAVVPR